MKVTLPVLTLAALLTAALPARAQTTTTTTNPVTGQTTIQTTTPPPPTVVRDEKDLNDLPNEFIVSGFVGGNFGRNTLDSSVDFGGAFDYLHSGAFGFEFLAGFAPKFKLDRLVGADADVNNYMANVIAAVPVGTFRAIRPFVSGGIGAITISQNSDITDNAVVNGANAVFSPNETHFGGNIGAGLMAFTGAFGIRGDVRYFSSIGTKNSTVPATTGVNGSSQSLLDNVSFWRANVGLAFRF